MNSTRAKNISKVKRNLTGKSAGKFGRKKHHRPTPIHLTLFHSTTESTTAAMLHRRRTATGWLKSPSPSSEAQRRRNTTIFSKSVTGDLGFVTGDLGFVTGDLGFATFSADSSKGKSTRIRRPSCAITDHHNHPTSPPNLAGKPPPDSSPDSC